MKFCKRLVTMLLAAALLLGAIPAVSAVEGYTGVADWFEPSLREMQELLVDTACSHRKMIRIAGDDKPAEVVRGQLMKLNSDHIRFVLSCMKENTTQVRNMRQYLLASLYNAPMTMHSSYAARVQHDLNAK